MPHVTWDPDIPVLLLCVHEEEIKGWALAFFSNEAGEELRLVLAELAITTAGRAQVTLRIVRQLNRATGAVRVVVRPASADDGIKMREWARRHERFVVSDFAHLRRTN